MPTLLGLLSVLLTIAAFTWYLHDTIKRGVRPHAMTWLAFGGFTTVGWLVQVRRGAGPGGWALGLTLAGCFVVSATSLWEQVRENRQWWKFPIKDWVWFVISVGIFCFYLRHPNLPIVAAVLVTLADLAAYGPTIDQGWDNPHLDSIPAFILNSAKFVPALLALPVRSIETVLYPAALLVMNAIVAWLLYYRGKRLKSLNVGPRSNFTFAEK
jgi:hypothetical protein